MRILSLNTGNYDDHPGWDYRRLKIAEQLFLQKADLVCLQEVRFNPLQETCKDSYQNSGEEILKILHQMGFWREYLILTLPAMFYPSGSSYPDTDQKVIWEGKAIITKLPVIEYGNFLLGNLHTSADQNRRTIFWCRLKDADHNFIIANIHWSTDHYNRMMNAQETVKFSEKFPDDEVILTGDFNCSIAEPELEYLLTSGFCDGWTFLGKTEGNTYPADNPTKRIDLALFNQKAVKRLSGIKISGSSKLSDHLCLVTDLD